MPTYYTSPRALHYAAHITRTATLPGAWLPSAAPTCALAHYKARANCCTHRCHTFATCYHHACLCLLHLHLPADVFLHFCAWRNATAGCG